MVTTNFTSKHLNEELHGIKKPEYRSQMVSGLVTLLETAPPGPVELDTSLLYDPKSDDSESGDENDRFHLSAYHPSHHRDQPADYVLQRMKPGYEEETKPFKPTKKETFISSQISRKKLALLEYQIEKECKETAECSFKPSIGRGPSTTGLPQMRVEQRLILDSKRRQQALERAHFETFKEADKDCTFTPRLVKPPDSLLPQGYRPPQERVLLSRTKTPSRIIAQEYPFKPQLNPQSLSIASQKKKKEVEEWYHYNNMHSRKQRLPAQQAETDHLFKPSINPNSKKILGDSLKIPSDFHDRMKYYATRTKKRYEESDYTFTPSTCATSLKLLAVSDRLSGALLESPKARSERLAYKDSQWMEMRRAALLEESVSCCSFQPAINEKSRKLAPSGRTPEEFVQVAADKEMRLATRRAEQEAAELAQCSFKPNTRKPSVLGYENQQYTPPPPRAWLQLDEQSKSGFEGMLQHVRDRELARQHRIEEAQRLRKEEELRGCSFKPKLISEEERVKENRAPVLVPGLDRVLQLKRLAKEREVDKKKREEKVFLLHPKTPKASSTKPKPFNLSSNK